MEIAKSKITTQLLDSAVASRQVVAIYDDTDDRTALELGRVVDWSDSGILIEEVTRSGVLDGFRFVCSFDIFKIEFDSLYTLAYSKIIESKTIEPTAVKATLDDVVMHLQNSGSVCDIVTRADELSAVQILAHDEYFLSYRDISTTWEYDGIQVIEFSEIRQVRFASDRNRSLQVHLNRLNI